MNCIARWKTRYIRYIVVNQQLNTLQGIGYTRGIGVHQQLLGNSSAAKMAMTTNSSIRVNPADIIRDGHVAFYQYAVSTETA